MIVTNSSKIIIWFNRLEWNRTSIYFLLLTTLFFFQPLAISAAALPSPAVVQGNTVSSGNLIEPLEECINSIIQQRNHGANADENHRWSWPPSRSLVLYCSQGTPCRTKDCDRAMWWDCYFGILWVSFLGWSWQIVWLIAGHGISRLCCSSPGTVPHAYTLHFYCSDSQPSQVFSVP